MRLFFAIPFYSLLFSLSLISSHLVSANVWVPNNEFNGYFDVNGSYTVVGAVKNSEDKPIIPSITFNVKDGNRDFSIYYILSIVDSGKDIPFKIKLPQVEGEKVILEKPQVNFLISNHNAVGIDVIYDRTLIKHSDGHTTGFIINNDINSAYGVKVYAVIYGKDGKFLDTGKSIETIPRMDPGQKIAFSMYPAPQLASKVSYYSCFALGEDPIQGVTIQRNGMKFNFTYLSSGYITDAKFDDLTQSLSLTARHPFPDKGFVNFMFPVESDNQKFSLSAEGKPVEFLQSKDPDGKWHIALNLAPQSTIHLTISGFEQLPMLPVANLRNYLLIIIPIAALVIIIVIWKKKKN
jgi:hypothetical protein